MAFLSHMMHAGGGLPKGMTDRITIFLSFSTYPVDYHPDLISFSVGNIFMFLQIEQAHMLTQNVNVCK